MISIVLFTDTGEPQKFPTNTFATQQHPSLSVSLNWADLRVSGVLWTMVSVVLTLLSSASLQLKNSSVCL